MAASTAGSAAAALLQEARVTAGFVSTPSSRPPTLTPRERKGACAGTQRDLGPEPNTATANYGQRPSKPRRPCRCWARLAPPQHGPPRLDPDHETNRADVS